MTKPSKEDVKRLLSESVSFIYNEYAGVQSSIQANLKDALDFMRALVYEIPQSTYSAALETTAKASRKKRIPCIESIPEGEVVSNESTISKCAEPEISSGRTRRNASKRAIDNMKQQQSIVSRAKLRRNSKNEIEILGTSKKSKTSKSKRSKSPSISTDEDRSARPSKIRKYDTPEGTISEKTLAESIVVGKKSNSRARTLDNNKSIGDNDTLCMPICKNIDESLTCEDIVGKNPVMSSTMMPNSTFVVEHAMDFTVVMDGLSRPKLNETVTLMLNKHKKSIDTDKTQLVSSSNTKKEFAENPRDKLEQLRKAMENKEFDELLTDDESLKEQRVDKTRNVAKTKKGDKDNIKEKRVRKLSSSDEEDIDNVPLESLRIKNTVKSIQNMAKPNVLFSPYAKESVRKRVEAFEQVGSNPKNVEINLPTRVTRTKTRALAEAKAEKANDAAASGKNIAELLARKSVAKAIRISVAKEARDNEESKENKAQPRKLGTLMSSERPKWKMQQQGATPLSKPKIQLPVSANRLQQTPVNDQLASKPKKPLTCSRSNIVTSVESFLAPKQQPKVPTANQDEESRRLKEEDIKRKRAEMLKLRMEEKRKKREEKELKIKLAREAKEQQELLKRQKAEREKEEKARLVQQAQEKQREEAEKKRLAQQQRAQEKEERRRLEEMLRLQRLQEQEEAERLLAEQRKREQEAEKRKDAEARAKQQATAEAIKYTSQMLGQAKANKQQQQQQHQQKQQQQPVTNYVLDSEPDDDDETDDETRPKYAVPLWAQSHVRRKQLEIQKYVSRVAVFRFFDTRRCTPDLTELFQGIDRRRLQRTSSAIWKTPPRYSMME